MDKTSWTYSIQLESRDSLPPQDKEDLRRDNLHHRPLTVCPRSLDPFYVVGYGMQWVKTYWTYSTS